nr:MAG TPA: Flagellar and Swarming motility protein [Caudoviricetes sp.]
MKFITLTDATQETRTYTININNIACIETIVNGLGYVSTRIHSKEFEYGRLFVKETEDEILQMIEGTEKL